MIRRVAAAGVLAVSFVWQLVLSGLATVRIILAPRAAAQPVLMRYEFAPMSEAGAALLASLVTLTPGSTVVDIDMETRCLLVHLLDGRDQAGAAEGIRRHFERHVRVLCGVKS